MGNLDNRVVIVTGGAGGIGIVASELMAARGAHVVIAELDGTRAEAAAADVARAVERRIIHNPSADRAWCLVRGADRRECIRRAERRLFRSALERDRG